MMGQFSSLSKIILVPKKKKKEGGSVHSIHIYYISLYMSVKQFAVP